MEKLYLETQNGLVPLAPAMVAKYHLQQGTRSPFTGGRIVGEGGDFTRKAAPQAGRPPVSPEKPGGIRAADEPDVVLTTSEIIDFVHGEDSTTPGV